MSKVVKVECPCCGERNSFRSLQDVYRNLFGGKRTKPKNIECGLCGAVLLATPVKGAAAA